MILLLLLCAIAAAAAGRSGEGRKKRRVASFERHRLAHGTKPLQKLATRPLFLLCSVAKTWEESLKPMGTEQEKRSEGREDS